MSHFDALPDHLLQELRLHPQGLSEYQLICLLREQRWPLFAETDLHEPLSLFHSHFVLFNALYRLNDQLAAQNLQVEISPLCIRLLPRGSGEPALTTANPLRDYYLDWQQLEETGREQVQSMLDGSFARINGQSEYARALACFGFAEDQPEPDAREIRSRFRRLVSQHHPDRGGCTKRLQDINQAMATLKQHGMMQG